jgi:protein-tyrosine-phosphatase
VTAALCSASITPVDPKWPLATSTILQAARYRSAPPALNPADKINPVAVQAMAEEGIDIAAEQPKILSDEAVKASDVVITMGCSDTRLTTANATKTGTSTTRQAKTSTTSGLFATKSGAGLNA